MAPSLPPGLEQPHTGNPQQPEQQANNQQLLQQHSLFPQGGSPMMIPLPQSVGGFLPQNQLTFGQQPLVRNMNKINFRLKNILKVLLHSRNNKSQRNPFGVISVPFSLDFSILRILACIPLTL